MVGQPPPDAIRVLVVEGDSADIQPAITELARSGLSTERRVVKTRASFLHALGAEEWDVVLGGFPVAGLSAQEAVAALRVRDLDLPLIIISGTISEDEAVDALRAGASQCIATEHLRRVGPIVEREVANRRLRRQTMEALRASEERLRQAQKLEAMGRMAGAIAHDFNNVLTIILGLSEMLVLDLPAEARSARDAQEIQLAAERASRLARQLLSFSRQEVLQPRVLDAAMWLRDLQPLVERLIGEDVSCRFQNSEGPKLVLIDPGQFEQVVINMVINARDAMPGGGDVTVELSQETVDLDRASVLRVRPGSFVTLEVSDTGNGMDKATLEQIFEPFFTTKSPGRGTGLGLSTVLDIVRHAGGGIDVETAPDRGTTFQVYFPQSEAQVSMPDVPATTRVPGGSSGTILLAEDEDGVRSLLEIALERDGHRVISTGTGPDAVLAARRSIEPIDLLITDVVMPGMSGPDVASNVSAAHPGARVLFLSGYAVHSALPPSLPSDPTAFLQKPFSVEALLAKVRQSLDRPA